MALGDISAIIDPAIEAASGMVGAFVPIGRVMLALAVTLAAMFAIYDWWTGAASGALARVVRAGLILTIPLTLLTGDNWSQTMQTTSKFFTSDLAAPLLGTTGGGEAGDAIKGAINKIETSMFPNTRKKETEEENAFEKAWKFISGQESIGGALFSALTEALFEVLLFLIASVLVIALVAALYGPLLALWIGAAFGPLLLAWMPFQPLSHLARNWFQFMLTQGFAVVVGVALAVIGAAAVEGYTNQMVTMANDPNLPWYIELTAKLGGFMASSAVILFVAWMLFKADDLAAAMIGGGGAGSSGVGAVIINKLSPKPKPDKPGKPGGGGGGGGGN